jgi:hypothetical protein
MEALEMERSMTHWNDDRLDELNGQTKEGFAKVDQRFEQVDRRFIRLEGEMKQGFAYADKRMEAGFERINDRIDRFTYLFLAAAVGLVGTGIANSIWG